MEKKELSALPALIEKTEKDIAMIHAKMSEPEIYRKPEELKQNQKDLKELELDLEKAFARWEELERKE